MTPTEAFLRARDTLLRHQDDLDAAREAFRWPELSAWNWAYDWFDVLAKDNGRAALRIVRDEQPDESLSFQKLGQRSRSVAAQVGNPPGFRVKTGSMGKPLPGYDVVLLDHAGKELSEGELALKLSPRPLGLMVGYTDDPARAAEVTANGYYRTGDEARRDEDGYIHFVGRGDDVFKSSDYRVSPFELESVLIEHELVAEAAVVPSPDAVRLAVPKAFIVLAPGVPQTAQTARAIFEHVKEKLAPYKRVRILEIAALPKTISGKIRRVELKKREAEQRKSNVARWSSSTTTSATRSEHRKPKADRRCPARVLKARTTTPRTNPRRTTSCPSAS
jgi:acyl-coenzyme A synthetase/AMP-(fatty) acid ligase